MREDVAGERVERVVAVGGPFAFAVAAQVDRVRAPALVGEQYAERCPAKNGVAASTSS